MQGWPPWQPLGLPVREGVVRLTRLELEALTKKQLVDLARRRDVSGGSGMTKDELVLALQKAERRLRRKTRKLLAPVQRAAARNTSGNPSPEEQIESSKFDVGVPTRDLSARVPRELPGGYGKDRIVLMVRDPYWLHCYWELTRQATQRAEAALGEEWHTSKPILRLLEVASRESTSKTE